MKKVIAIVMAGICFLAMSLLGGCFGHQYEDGFFVCYKIKGSSDVVGVIGLTELGHQQKVIVMPETISGYKYVLQDSRGYGVKPCDWGINNTLEKIYFEYEARWYRDKYNNYILENFSKLKKVIINSNSAKNVNIKTHSSINPPYFLYSNYGNYDHARFQKQYDEINDENYNSLFYHIYEAIPANVEFMYNYEDAPNEGYYWIDDVDDGEKMEIMPPEPEREGYTFGGWYCGPECENEWSFDTVINKPEPVLTSYEHLVYYPENPIYFIYAKWIENK